MDREYILDKIRYWENQLKNISDYSSHYQPKYGRRMPPGGYVDRPYRKSRTERNYGRY